MAYKEQKATDAIKLTDYLDKPMEAYYIGSKSVDTKFGEQSLHEFEKKDGKKVSVWGFTALNRLLEHTTKGVLCKVTYTGKSETKNKYGNKSHTCTLFFDEADRTDAVIENEPGAGGQDNPDDLPF